MLVNLGLDLLVAPRIVDCITIVRAVQQRCEVLVLKMSLYHCLHTTGSLQAAAAAGERLARQTSASAGNRVFMPNRGFGASDVLLGQSMTQ